ncbi:hypothetical protein FQN60_012418 [Etheostoma spectabile]|uniref:C2H2-type domain-containing protein n=1 Tax=Etheostoma spectabile TaxID=54343 RepID=A0A5J5DQ08_9PERO|nr:hypothetical protein FQN60_012418 [Etheostoma spectabile]
MFEDPELPDPLSLSLNESFDDQNSPRDDSKRAPASPDYNCETPEIQVIIKEEEESWTASENQESCSSEGEKEDTCTNTCHPNLKACGKESSISHGVKRQQRVFPGESGGHDLSGQSSSAREGRQRHMLMDSDEIPKISCLRGKAPAKDSPEHKPAMSHELKASANLEDQTLHLTVRLQAGDDEEEEEEQQDEEIGGLINSDGEVVEWDSRNSLDRGSDCTESFPPIKGVFLSESQLQGQNQRESSSPTLIMEVVSVGEDEEREEGEEKERVVKMPAVSPLYRGKRPRRKKKVPEVTVVSLDVSDAEKEVPANPVSRRTRRKRNVPIIVESEESYSKTVRRVAAKRPHRRRKDTKLSAEGESTRASAGRKGAVDFDDEVNPIASELTEYLKSLPGESRIRSSLRCLECGNECESHSALQAHHITTHTESAGESDAVKQSSSQLLFCRRCGIQFNEKEKLEEHMKTHIKEKRYSCPDCGKRFINESYIQIHQRIHTGEKPFLCSQCGRSFHTASSLKLHEMQHSGERPFACSICGKTFRINSYLTAHYQTHIKERPFICGVCGKGYSRAEELKVHHRLHTGERPYECRECGKSFIYRQGLRQHQRTHAGKRIGPTRQLGRPKQQARLDI